MDGVRSARSKGPATILGEQGQPHHAVGPGVHARARAKRAHLEGHVRPVRVRLAVPEAHHGRALDVTTSLKEIQDNQEKLQLQLEKAGALQTRLRTEFHDLPYDVFDKIAKALLSNDPCSRIGGICRISTAFAAICRQDYFLAGGL